MQMEKHSVALGQEIVMKTEDLAVGYRNRSGTKVIQEHLDLYLGKGTVTTLLGLNGSGKSTLLRALCGFDKPLAGKIELLGRSLDSYAPRKLACLLGVVLTERGNFGGLKVWDMVSMGRYPYTGFFGRLSEEDCEIVDDSIAKVGMTHKSASYVSDLSDGERQKIMIAKSLAQKAPVIILDEPTAFLDVTSRIETMILLRTLASEHGITVLLSSHDLNISLELSDRIWMLSSSRKAVCGTPAELLQDDMIGQFFNRGKVSFDPREMKWRF